MPQNVLMQRLACIEHHVNRARPGVIVTQCRRQAARWNVRHGFSRTQS